MDARRLAQRAISWGRSHPADLRSALRGMVRQQLTVPLDALRFFAGELRGKKAPRDVEFHAAGGGLRLGATLEVMRAALRVSATLVIEDVHVAPGTLRLVVRVRGIKIDVLGASDSPVAALISSGALDLSQPGKLIGHLPKRPPVVLEAEGDRIVLDLMRDRGIARRLERPLALLAPLVTVTRIELTRDAIVVQLRMLPSGLGDGVRQLRAAL